MPFAIKPSLANRNVALFTGLGLGLLLAVSVFSYWSGVRYLNSNHWRSHSEEVIAVANELQILTERAETAQRGYLITETESFVDSFNESSQQLSFTSRRLAELVVDNPQQLRLVGDLDSLLQLKLESLRTPIRLTKETHSSHAGILKIREGHGRILMDQVRAKFDEIRAVESSLLGQRSKQAEEDFNLSSHLILFGLFCAFSLLLYVIRVLREETHRRSRTEKELIKAESKANEASALKSQFLANMSHEIRTPLNGVIGMTNILLKTKLDSDQADYVGTIRDSSNTLLSLINEILDISKIEAGKLRLEDVEFDLRSTMASTQSLLAFAANAKGLELDLEIADDVPNHLHGDPLRLRQIAINLLNNAIKFSDHGTVRLRITRGESKSSKARLLFEVIDQGIGIPEKTRKQLFQTFAQGDESTTRRYGGTGLGLAITKQLVEMMGGSIDVESKPGQGSRFYFDLFFDVAAHVEKPIAEPSAPTTPRALRGHILIAEDNLINQKVLGAMLKVMGCTFTMTQDGRQAIAALKRERFDLVLMDGQMPGMDGYQASQLIRSTAGEGWDPNIPIIAVTACAIKGDVERCLNAGMNDYLSKPISEIDLREKLQKCLAGKQTQLDPIAIAKLRDLDGGGLNLLQEVIAIFQKTAPEAVLRMQTAIARNDFPALNATAHSFKSTCANIGANSLRELAARLEKLNSADDSETALTLIHALENELRFTTEELEKYAAA